MSVEQALSGARMGTAMNRPVTTSGRFVAPDPGHFPSSAITSKNGILDEDEETRDNVCLWGFSNHGSKSLHP